jgi:hypothetical protein
LDHFSLWIALVSRRTVDKFARRATNIVWDFL